MTSNKWTDRLGAILEEYYQAQLSLPDGNVVTNAEGILQHAVDQLARERDELRAENEVLRTALLDAARDVDTRQADNEQLRAALVQIENWVGKLPGNMGEAALIFEYIRQACAVLDTNSPDAPETPRRATPPPRSEPSA